MNFDHLLSGIALSESLTDEEKEYLANLIEDYLYDLGGTVGLKDWQDMSPLNSDKKLNDAWEQRRFLMNLWINDPKRYKLESLCIKVTSKDSFIFPNDPEKKPRKFHFDKTWLAFPELAAFIQPGMELVFIAVKDTTVDKEDGLGNYYTFGFVTICPKEIKFGDLSKDLQYLINNDQDQLLDVCFELNQRFLCLRPDPEQ